MATKKILVVDDSEICREVAGFALRRRGYDVATFGETQGLDQALRDERPDLVLVDVNMPTAQGETAFDIVARHRILHEYPMVLYSDRSEAELAALAARLGAAGFIRKGADADELSALVGGFLAL